MAADDVAARVQFANLSRVQKAGRADVAAGHEEMTGEAVTLERVRRCHRAHAAIVERQDGREVRDARCEVRGPACFALCTPHLAHRTQMLFEPLRRYLVEGGVPPGKAAAVLESGGDDVVIHERRRSLMYAVSHG